MSKQLVFLILLLFCFQLNYGQNKISYTADLNWHENAELVEDEDVGYTITQRLLWCDHCQEDLKENYFIPVYSKQIKLPNQEISRLTLDNKTTELMPNSTLSSVLSDEFDYEITYLRIKGELYANINIIPLRKTALGIEVLKHFTINIESIYKNTSGKALYKKDQTYTSVLSSGEIHKIAVEGSGVHKITRDFLTNQGISTTGIKMSEFKVYGNGGIMLPEIIAEYRAEDLRENAVFIYDENNNDVFDANDYILWYAQGADDIKYNLNTNTFGYSKNDFENKAYYFLKWNNGKSLRVDTLSSNQSASPIALTITDYDYVIHHELDEINHIHSGRMWWGDEMSGSSLLKNFTYNITGLNTNKPIVMQTITSARSLTSSLINIKLNSSEINSIHAAVSGKFDANYTAGPKFNSLQNFPLNETVNISYQYSKPLSDSKAWIDYFDLICRRDLMAYGGQQHFFATESAVNGNVKYIIDNANGYLIWNVSDPTRPHFQSTFDESSARAFIHAANNSAYERYQIFKSGDAISPSYVAKIENQNLHGLEEIEYIIVSYSSFIEDAERLAQFHRDRSGLSVAVVDVQHIYNEFSSGSQDLTAIRDFTKLLYDRGQTSGTALKYICLFGDASYDYKDRISNNTNYVPIYESFNSYLPAGSHCSDDYYAILDDDEGYWGIAPKFEGLDIGVGRLPATSSAEARLIVDKIIHYHSDLSYGNWTQKLSFLGDDEDSNVHFLCSENLMDVIEAEAETYNLNKIHMDAYEQVSFGSGNKYPEVNAAVDKSINQGTLIFNYVGHGGSNGMAHERVVTRPQITEWTNYDKLSFYITASCELAAIDNPAQESPGELMLFNPKGGAIGMVATSRVVYIGANCDLNEDILNNNMFNIINNESKPLGDVYMETRNRANTGQVINKRSFLLIADPAMGLLAPPHDVVTTRINNQSFSSFNDTLKALSKVTIEGEIRHYNGSLMSNFNGVLYPTIYDKKASYQTRANDPKSLVDTFESQNSVIYKGKISVTNGLFSFSFIIPKDIAYHYGQGKISYYANDINDHAGGYENTIIIGGTTDSLKDDDVAPELKLFIDDRSWVFGGSTNFTPLLLADIFDENGINTVGSGIGREMEAILDEGTDNEQIIVLNEYFEPELNSYQSGKISYRFDDLLPGRHTLRLKVWDVYNNSSEAYTEFVVANDEAISIAHLLNYPNPFNNATTFHFDHNKAGQNLVVNLAIYTISGKIVKSMTTTVPNANAHFDYLFWDGKDEFGDKLAQGVYLYNIEIKAEDGSIENQTEKLYIIK